MFWSSFRIVFENVQTSICFSLQETNAQSSQLLENEKAERLASEKKLTEEHQEALATKYTEYQEAVKVG